MTPFKLVIAFIPFTPAWNSCTIKPFSFSIAASWVLPSPFTKASSCSPTMLDISYSKLSSGDNCSSILKPSASSASATASFDAIVCTMILALSISLGSQLQSISAFLQASSAALQSESLTPLS